MNNFQKHNTGTFLFQADILRKAGKNALLSGLIISQSYNTLDMGGEERFCFHNLLFQKFLAAKHLTGVFDGKRREARKVNSAKFRFVAFYLHLRLAHMKCL